MRNAYGRMYEMKQRTIYMEIITAIKVHDIRPDWKRIDKNEKAYQLMRLRQLKLFNV